MSIGLRSSDLSGCRASASKAGALSGVGQTLMWRTAGPQLDTKTAKAPSGVRPRAASPRGQAPASHDNTAVPGKVIIAPAAASNPKRNADKQTKRASGFDVARLRAG